MALRCYVFLVTMPALKITSDKNLNTQIVALRLIHFQNSYYPSEDSF